MALRTTAEPIYLEWRGRFGIYPDLLTPPPSYSAVFEAASITMPPAAQSTIRVKGRNYDTKGRVLLSIQQPDGDPARLQLRALTYTPALYALSIGGDVTEVVQAAGTVISQAVTLALGVGVPINGRFLDAASFVVGTSDSASVGVAGSNTGLTFTALQPTASGDSDITITIVDPASASAALAVSVSGSDISVSLETNSSSVEISTAAQVLAAVNAHVGASALVVCSHTGSSTGAGTMPAVSETALTGGALVSASDYEVDDVLALVIATGAAATGAQRIYAETAAVTVDSYTGGDATQAYVHLVGTCRNAATGKIGRLDIWQANLSSTEPVTMPQTDSAFEALFEGDMLVPSIPVQGVLPTRAFRFDDTRVSG